MAVELKFMYLGSAKKVKHPKERNKMVLEVRSEWGSATPNRLTPLIPLRGTLPPAIVMNSAKGICPHWGGDSISGRVDAREFAPLGEKLCIQVNG
jgi:hypothetical protein